MIPVRLSESELGNKGICRVVKMVTRDWLYKGGLIQSGKIIRTMGARFLTVGEKNDKWKGKKTELNSVGLESERSM